MKPNESLFEALKSVLEGLDGCCLDNEEDVERVATVLTEAILPMLPKENEEEEIGPEPGTWAFAARVMAGPNPSEEEAEFWDNWKEEMKQRDLED